MAAVAQFANGLWNNAATGLTNLGAAAGTAGAAAFLHVGRFGGLRMPTSPLGILMLSSLAAVTILVMILSPVEPDIVGGQHYYSPRKKFFVHFEVEGEIVRLPLPPSITKDGSFSSKAVPGISKNDPIVLPPSVLRVDVENIVAATDSFNKGHVDAVSFQELDSVLKLTAIDAPFDFELLGQGLRKQAIAAVDALVINNEIPDAELLSLGLDNSIGRWIACPAEKLARRDEILSPEERQAIDHRATHVVHKIHHDSFQWLHREQLQGVVHENGRQDYPDFWDGVKAGFAYELDEDKDWLPLLDSPCV